MRDLEYPSNVQPTLREWPHEHRMAAARDGWYLLSLYQLGPDGAPEDAYFKTVPLSSLICQKTTDLVVALSAAAGEPHAICALKLTAPKGNPK